MEANVLTLIAAPGARLPPKLAFEIVDALEDLGGRVGAPTWLAPQTACDVPFRAISLDQADAVARHRLPPGEAIDLVAQRADGRRKRLLVADMESTMIENEMLDELADFLGLRAEVEVITRAAMNDEIDFATAMKQRVLLLKDMKVDRLAEAATRIRVMPGAHALVATMRRSGARTALVSGGFRFFTRRMASELGFDLELGNDLVVEGDRLTGAIAEPLLDRQSKLVALTRLASEDGLPLTATLTVGDGANDVPMLQAAGLGVAFRAKPSVAARVRVRIDHGDLTALLFAQGYRADEIFSP